MIKYVTPAFQQNIWFSGSPKVTFRISLNVTFPEPGTRCRLWPVQVDFSTGNGDREVWLIVLESLDATLNIFSKNQAHVCNITVTGYEIVVAGYQNPKSELI